MKKILAYIFIVCSLLPFAVAASISIAPLQQAQGTSTGGSSTFNTTLGASPTQGNMLTFEWDISDITAGVIVSLSQTGVTWAKAAISNTTNDSEIWYGQVTSASAGTVITTTLTGSPVAAGRSAVQEWSGINSFNAGQGNTGNSTTPTTASMVQRGETLFIATTRKQGTFNSGPTSNWTALVTNNSGAQHGYIIASSTTNTSFSTNWVWATGTAWDVTIASFYLQRLSGRLIVSRRLALGGRLILP